MIKDTEHWSCDGTSEAFPACTPQAKPCAGTKVCNLSAAPRSSGKIFVKYSALFDVCLCDTCQELERQTGAG